MYAYILSCLFIFLLAYFFTVGEIKKTQVLMGSPEWGQVGQEERTRVMERHEGEGHEEVKGERE